MWKNSGLNTPKFLHKISHATCIPNDRENERQTHKALKHVTGKMLLLTLVSETIRKQILSTTNNITRIQSGFTQAVYF